LDERVIVENACIAEGCDYLTAHEPRFGHALSLLDKPVPLRLRADGFRALLDAIVSQQISVAAADGIWRRMRENGACSAAGIKRKTDEELRACGLSRQKIRYARALAASGISYRSLREMPADDVVAELTKVTGIGTWTAEIYAMFSLGRADVFAPGDLALQEAARLLFDLKERPNERQMRAMSLDWSPWRGVAARILWAYYHVVKSREGVR
jgi:DNA-3-methyladenine glycosylase II